MLSPTCAHGNSDNEISKLVEKARKVQSIRIIIIKIIIFFIET